MLIVFLRTFAVLSLTLSEHIHAICGQNDNEIYLLVFCERLVVNESVVFFLGDSPASEFADVSEHTDCSIFVDIVNMKNNRDEIVGIFIQEKVWLKNSQSEAG